MSVTITAKTKTVMERDRFGKFASLCEDAAMRTVKETIERGARTSRSMAPAGKERWRYDNRPGYIPLKRSIRTEMQSRTRGYWYSVAPHARYVEEGTAAHQIRGKLHFTWRGGWFVWDRGRYQQEGIQGPTTILRGRFYRNADANGAWVWHPGTNAKPFLGPAFDRVVRRQMMDIAKREFPG